MAFLLLQSRCHPGLQMNFSHPIKKPGFDKPGQLPTIHIVTFGGLAVMVAFAAVDP